MPKSPKITEGIPASRFTVCEIGATSRFGQNLYRHTAVKRPIVTPMITDNAVTYKLVTSMGSIP